MSDSQTSIPPSAVEQVLASIQVELAHRLLGESALDALISTEDTPEAFDRIRRVPRTTHLLCQAHPGTGVRAAGGLVGPLGCHKAIAS